MQRLDIATVLAALTFAAGPSFAQTSVTSCGQSWSGDGSLASDLDCGTGNDAVVIGSGTLSMNGHTLVGRVHCTGSCELHGPGNVFGSPRSAPEPSQAILATEDLVLTSLTVAGAITTYRELEILDSTIDAGDAGSDSGIWGGDGIVCDSSEITGSLDTYIEDSVRVRRCNVSGSVNGGRVNVRESEVGAVAAGRLAVVQDSTVTTGGVSAYYNIQYPRTLCYGERGKLRILRSTVHGGTGWAVSAQKGASVTDSEIVAGTLGGVFAAGLQNRCYLHEIGNAVIAGTTIDGGQVGVLATNVSIQASTITGWTHLGVLGRWISGIGSVVGSDNLAPECGIDVECPDLASPNRPVFGSGCGSSRVSGFPMYYDAQFITSESWGVCSGD